MISTLTESLDLVYMTTSNQYQFIPGSIGKEVGRNPPSPGCSEHRWRTTVPRQGVATSSGVERIAGAEVEGGIRRSSSTRDGRRLVVRHASQGRPPCRVETVVEPELAATAPPASFPVWGAWWSWRPEARLLLATGLRWGCASLQMA